MPEFSCIFILLDSDTLKLDFQVQILIMIS